MAHAAMGLWDLFTDVSKAYEIVERANELYQLSAVPKNKAIIGSKPDKSKPVLRARHASSIGAQELPEYQPKTVFAEVCESEYKCTQEIQWAVLTLLAIDETFRESIARASPPAAANLVRTLPGRYERYLMGGDDSSTATPFEAVCDWTLRVEMVYKAVTPNK